MGNHTHKYSWEVAHRTSRARKHLQTGQYDLRTYWRGKAFQRFKGEPEVILRARAFATVLREIPLGGCDAERFAGSRERFVTSELPDTISIDDYKTACQLCQQMGQRDFQAGFDHAVPDYETLMDIGISGIIDRAQTAVSQPHTSSEKEFLRAAVICMEALRQFALRHADIKQEKGDSTTAAVLRNIAGAPPKSFQEALQLVWLVHLAFVSEGRSHMAIGRIDQYLFPFLQRDMENGALDRENALDLVCHFWVKIAELEEITNICIGGMTPDGKDATNELSYLCLEATAKVQTPHTNLSARFHDGSTDAFHRACFECIRTGVGFPAIFNDEVLIPGLTALGIPLDVARDYCMVGCIETMFPGRQPPWGDGVPGFSGESNIQCLERALRHLKALHNRSYGRLVQLFKEELREFFRQCAEKVNDHIARFPPEAYPDPFLSALTRDCIGRARDINNGGAQFERFYKCAGGENLATLADSMAAVKKLVFDEQLIDYDELIDALDADFENDENLRQMLLHRAPKYGNDDPYVDRIAGKMLNLILDEVMRLPPLHGGGRFVACAAGNIHNIARGRKVGATPDGRRAGTPLSDATSPHFGQDLQGPTAILQSMRRTASDRVLGGRVANMKFEPAFFAGEDGVRRFVSITKTFVRNRIQELQFNFTGNETLLDAQQHPEEHRNLVVRVSGFSAYFTTLRKDVQNDVIRRRAHGHS